MCAKAHLSNINAHYPHLKKNLANGSVQTPYKSNAVSNTDYDNSDHTVKNLGTQSDLIG